MPLSKIVDLGIGANGTYWPIFWVTVNMETSKISFALKGYVDKATKQAGKGSLGERQYTMDTPAGAATMTWTQLVQAMQDYAKTQTEFTGATDVA